MSVTEEFNTARNKQDLASQPEVSAFVPANAGAGKTHVLVGRVIRLLLNGVQPERILCLTYTRAAAAEMSERLFDKLSGWIARDDGELTAMIREDVAQSDIEVHHLDEARRLFHPCPRDTRRAQGSDDPRVLRTPAAAISHRGGRGARFPRSE